MSDPSCTQPIDFTTDPNDIRLKTPSVYHNYSPYECDNREFNPYRFMVLGQRNPVQCCVSQPFITNTGKNDTIDFMRSCDNVKYAGYNRNGRYFESIYK